MNDLIEIGEAFIRYLDKLESERPGNFYPASALAVAMAEQQIILPDDVSVVQFLQELQQWDWVESNGDGFEIENQSFRVTAKGQYRAAASIDYAAQFSQAVNALPEAPIEHKAVAGSFASSAFADSAFDTQRFEGKADAAVDSHFWTGLPRVGVLRDTAISELKAALSVVDDTVSKSGASNEEKAQARAYVLAIHALADAPDPPADLIWEIVSRANQLSGIASFFVSIIALYVAVAN